MALLLHRNPPPATKKSPSSLLTPAEAVPGKVVEIEKLDKRLPQLLMQLSRGEIMAIRIPQFINEDVAAQASEGILNSPDAMPYWYTNNTVSRRGMTFSEVFGQAGVKSAEELAASAASGNAKEEVNTAYSGLDTYYNGSVGSMAGVRSHFAPFLSPIDKLRVECDELMPSGAHIEHLHPGRKMMCGIVRVIEPNAKVLVHQDRLDWDLQTLPHFGSPLLQQLTCNCYLSLPDQGGELKLWPFALEKPEYMRLANGEYGIRDEAQFGPPLLLKPRVGELIIFNSQKLHAINASSSKRIAVSSFIGFRGVNQPLTFWS